MVLLDKRELRVTLDRARPPVACELAAGGPLRVGNLSRRGFFVEWPAAGGADAPGLRPGDSVGFTLSSGRGDVAGVATVRWARGRTLGPGGPAGAGLQLIELHEDGEGAYLELVERHIGELRLAELMSDEVIAGTADDSVRPDMGLAEAVALLKKTGWPHLVVAEDGQPLGIVKREVAWRYWLEAKELEAQRLAGELDRKVAVLAHDLRTPLTMMHATSGLLAAGELSPEDYQRQGLPETMEACCAELLAMIDGTLSPERIAAGGVRLKTSVVDLEELSRKVAEAYAPLAAARAVAVKVAVPAAIPRIRADAHRLEQLLGNLLGHALRNSPEGSRVVLGVKPMHSQVAIWVADHGPGETVGSVHEALETVIVKRLVAAHGGSMIVESRPGLGTTQTVRLPIGELQ